MSLSAPSRPRPALAAAAALLALAAALPAARAADAPAYPVKFERSFKAGQAFDFSFSTDSRLTQKRETPGAAPRSSSTVKKLVFDADLRIAAVDDTGREARVDLTVKRFNTQNGPGVPTTLLPDGARLTVTYSAAALDFKRADGELSADALAGLQQVFKPHQPRKVSDDDRFGTADPKRVGDSWPVNAAALTRDMTGTTLPAYKVSGAVTLRAVKPVGGVECAQFETRLALRDVPVQGATADEVKESVTNVLIASDLPTDPTLPAVGTAVKVTSHLLVEQPLDAGGALRTTVDSETTQVTAWTPVK
jgi:hypothetical protein